MSLKYVLALNGLGSNFSPKMAGETCALSISPSRAQLYQWNISAPLVWKLVRWEKQITFPCKFMKMRAEVEGRSNRVKQKKIIREKEVVMVGGNGREPQFCVSVWPLWPLPRKTRLERRWDLISAWRHGRKLVPLGVEDGCVCMGVRLYVCVCGVQFMSSQRKETPVLFTHHPSSLTSSHCLCRWCILTHVEPLLPATLSQWTQLGTNPWCRSVQIWCRSLCHTEVNSVQISVSASGSQLHCWRAGGILPSTCAEN